ncbi:MAG: NUDIX domain-containing protein [Bacteroidales bacterium]|nr:NUDIX domain-containing protein [Bacteroidales bacterium]
MQKVYFQDKCIHVDDDRFAEFSSRFREIPAGGGLVGNRKGEYLLILRHNLWDLPKGKMEPGESMEECALREVEEETGLHGLTLGRLICVTHHTYTVFGENVLKHTWWYAMTDDREEPLIPQQEEDITEVRWVEKERLPEFLGATYPSIREVFVNAGLL